MSQTAGPRTQACFFERDPQAAIMRQSLRDVGGEARFRVVLTMSASAD
jgi:hypothetical protein